MIRSNALIEQTEIDLEGGFVLVGGVAKGELGPELRGLAGAETNGGLVVDAGGRGRG